MGLFKKKERKGGGDEGWVPQPLLGDSTGSPYYAKSAAYAGEPAGSGGRAEPAGSGGRAEPGGSGDMAEPAGSAAQPWDLPGQDEDGAAPPELLDAIAEARRPA